MELALRLAQAPLADRAATRNHGPTWLCRGDGRTGIGGYCYPVPEAVAQGITGELREKDGKLMIPVRTGGANSARKGARRHIGVLALAVASVTALAACSSTSSSSNSSTTTTTPGETTQPGSIGAIPAAGTPSGTAGSITYALPPG